MVRIVADLASDWRQLDERIEPVTDEIETLAKSDDGCRRVMTVPGIGPIISSAMVAAIGNGAAFARGRDFSAWIGLVPKQMSTGDRTILGRITKRGNGYLRATYQLRRVFRNCRRPLHAKAKAEAGYRFYALYDKISREDILAHAYGPVPLQQGRVGGGWPGLCGHRRVWGAAVAWRTTW